MKVLAALSGGVDSSVAAALLRDEGHEVVAVTLRLWGGPSDTGCCSVTDVADARRVADRLGIDHLVWNYSEEFDRHVVEPYVEAHRRGSTPNPCVECNRHLKFDLLLERARRLGFDAVATGHHARRVAGVGGGWWLARGADASKDQSYVLHPLLSGAIEHVRFPIGDLTKAEVRARAARLGLRTATKPDSQDVCFIARSEGRRSFLGARIPLHPARVVDGAGTVVGRTDAVELVTLGQRKGLGLAGGAAPRFVVAVRRDGTISEVVVGSAGDLDVDEQRVAAVTWSGRSAPTEPLDVLVQTSAHGPPRPASLERRGDEGALVRWRTPSRRVAPGQSVVAYVGDVVVAGGVAEGA